MHKFRAFAAGRLVRDAKVINAYPSTNKFVSILEIQPIYNGVKKYNVMLQLVGSHQYSAVEDWERVAMSFQFVVS